MLYMYDVHSIQTTTILEININETNLYQFPNLCKLKLKTEFNVLQLSPTDTLFPNRTKTTN